MDLVTHKDQDAESCCSSSSGYTEDAPVCWICLDGTSVERPLVQPCGCPRHCHAQCLARWQLQSAGTRKETHCDFCNQMLPDWKPVLTPPVGVASPAVMNVNFDGKTYSFEVEPGESGYKLFTAAIRKAFSLPGDSELNITFTCDDPVSGALLTLQGAHSFDAAVYCASVSAAKRLHSRPPHDQDQPQHVGATEGAPTASSAGSGGRSSSDCAPPGLHQQRASSGEAMTGSRGSSRVPSPSAPVSPAAGQQGLGARQEGPRPGSAPHSRPPPGRAAAAAAAAAAAQQQQQQQRPRSLDLAPGSSADARSVSCSNSGESAGTPDATRRVAGHWGSKFRSALGELLGKLQEPSHQRGASAAAAAGGAGLIRH